MKRITRALAVKLFCMGCFGWTEKGGQGYTGPKEAIKMVRECESTECALYNFRTGVETTPGLVKNFSQEQRDSLRNSLKTRQKIERVSQVGGIAK